MLVPLLFFIPLSLPPLPSPPHPLLLQELAGDFLKVVELVETTVDLEKADAHEFVIKSSFDEGLQRE